jgi:hypothetical protein
VANQILSSPTGVRISVPLIKESVMPDENIPSRIDGSESRVGCEVETTMSHLGSIITAMQAVCDGSGLALDQQECLDLISDLLCVADRYVKDLHELLWPEADAG